MNARSLEDIARQVAFERLAIALGADSGLMDEEQLVEEAAERISQHGDPPRERILLPHAIEAGLVQLADAIGRRRRGHEGLLEQAVDLIRELSAKVSAMPAPAPPPVTPIPVQSIIAGERVAIVMVEADADGSLGDRVSWSAGDTEHLPIRERSEDEHDAGWFLVATIKVPDGNVMAGVLDAVTGARTLPDARRAVAEYLNGPETAEADGPTP